MGQVRKKLRQAIEEQRLLERRQPRSPSDVRVEAAFRPVRESAEELRDELSNVGDLEIEIEPDGVWIGLYDKHLWFTYDPEQQAFVGSELDTLWMEGGLREETFKWDSAEACTGAMIQACARYVLLADAIARLHSGG